jgi:hypothetical protein
MRLAQRRELPPPPPRPLTGGVYNFPFYFHCRQPWFRLSISILVLGGVVLQILKGFRTLPQ